VSIYLEVLLGYTTPMEIKALLTIIATILVFVGYAPYLRDTIKGKTRPHIFSFFLWSLTTFIIFFLQIKNGGGIGSWITVAIGLMTFITFLLSLKNGKRDIRKIDIVFLCLALLTIPIWLIAKQPIISISLLVLIDIFAFIPSMRKSWVDPWSETLSYYLINTLRHGLNVFALLNITVITALSPAIGVLFNSIFIVILLLQRSKIKKPD